MKRLFFIVFLALSALSQSRAEDFSIWTSMKVSKTFNQKLTFTTSGGFHTQKAFSNFKLWSVGESASYRFNRHISVASSYTFISYYIQDCNVSTAPSSFNFWSPRHSLSASVTGTTPMNNCDLSVRLMYNMIYRPEYLFKSDAFDAIVPQKTNQKLRIRIQLSWNLENCPLTPFVNVERFTRLGGERAVKLEKNRYMLGTDYAIDKRNNLQIYFMYQDHADDVELSGSVAGIAYTLKF